MSGSTRNTGNRLRIRFKRFGVPWAVKTGIVAGKGVSVPWKGILASDLRNGRIPERGIRHDPEESLMEEIIVSIAALQRIAHGKAPIVGLARPGERPFATNRGILKGLIEGLTDTNAAAGLNGALDIMANGRTYHLLDLGNSPDLCQSVIRPLERWAETQRKARDRKAKAPHIPKGQRVPDWLLKAYKQACRDVDYSRPYKPREFFAWLHPKTREERYDWEPKSEEVRADVLSWYKRKAKRKQFARIQAGYFRNRDLKALYHTLRAFNISYEPFSKQPKGLRDHGEAEYVRHLSPYGKDGYRKPYLPCLDKWEPNGLEDLRKYNEALKANCKNRERVAYLKTQIESYQAGAEIDMTFEE